jgi:hypothetical protein
MGINNVMIVTKVNKKSKLTYSQGIKYQLITYCFINGISLSDSDLDALVLLTIKGQVELNAFCKDLVEAGIFGSEQSARNVLSKVERRGFIIKEGRSKKTITLSEECGVINKDVVLLDFQFLCYNPDEAVKS